LHRHPTILFNGICNYRYVDAVAVSLTSHAAKAVEEDRLTLSLHFMVIVFLALMPSVSCFLLDRGAAQSIEHREFQVQDKRHHLFSSQPAWKQDMLRSMARPNKDMVLDIQRGTGSSWHIGSLGQDWMQGRRLWRARFSARHSKNLLRLGIT
jgi:hypothetical protein